MSKKKAADGSPKVDHLMKVAAHLLDVLKKENAALIAHDKQTALGLADRKDTISRLYADQINAFAGNPDLMAEASPRQRKMVALLGERLDAAVKENERLLKGEMKAAQKLLQSIVDAAKERHQHTAVYQRDAQMEDGPAKGKGSALTYNKET